MIERLPTHVQPKETESKTPTSEQVFHALWMASPEEGTHTYFIGDGIALAINRTRVERADVGSVPRVDILLIDEKSANWPQARDANMIVGNVGPGFLAARTRGFYIRDDTRVQVPSSELSPVTKAIADLKPVEPKQKFHWRSATSYSLTHEPQPGTEIPLIRELITRLTIK